MMRIFLLIRIISGIILVAFGIVTSQTNLLQPVYAHTNDYNIAVGIPGKDISGVDGVGAVYIYNGTSGSLLRTINNPEGNISSQFGQFVTYAENKLVVGAPHIKNTENKIGAVYVYNGTSGSLLFTIRNPETSVSVYDGKTKYLSSEFGNSIAIVKDKLAVGAPAKNFTNVVGSGAVYFFNASNGSMLFTKNNPDPNQAHIFGDPIKSFGNKTVVGMVRKNSTTSEVVDAVYVFNGTTRQLLYTVDDPEPQDSAEFGRAIALDNKTLAVGAPKRTVDEYENAGAIYLFDEKTNSLFGIIYDPDPDDDDLFGSTVTFLGKNIAVGAPGKGVLDSGIVYIFDTENGKLLKKLSNPQVGFSYEFGSSIVSKGNMLAVGAPGMHKIKNEGGGVVYMFNGTTGSLLHIINNTSPMPNDGFGNSVTFVGQVSPDLNLVKLQESNIGNASNPKISNDTLTTKEDAKISDSQESEKKTEDNVTKPSQEEKGKIEKVLGKLAPLKQFKSKVSALNVECNDGLQLIMKAKDHSPACVKPNTAEKLIERGWAKPAES